MITCFKPIDILKVLLNFNKWVRTKKTASYVHVVNFPKNALFMYALLFISHLHRLYCTLGKYLFVIFTVRKKMLTSQFVDKFKIVF